LYGGFLAAASFAAAVLSGTKWKFWNNSGHLHLHK
jgi:hypothetical protein